MRTQNVSSKSQNYRRKVYFFPSNYCICRKDYEEQIAVYEAKKQAMVKNGAAEMTC